MYPEKRSSLYALVRVHDSREKMLRAAGHPARERGTQAVVCPMEVVDCKRAKCRKLPLFAELHLWRGKLTLEVIVHEAFHLTIAYGRRIRFDFSRLDADDSINDDEERMAYAQGYFAAEITNRLIDAGLLPKLVTQ